MGSPLPPDPYTALGVPKDASSAVIKTTYRKLALKFHPDKVTDDSQKEAAADQFHRIQTAYEIVGDEDRRARYDAQVKLAELRKDVLQRQGGAGRGVEVRTAQYEMPTPSPGRAAFTARGPERVYEERRPTYDNDSYFDTASKVSSSRKGEYVRPTRRPSPRGEERIRVAKEKENEKVRRSEKNRRSAKDERSNRDRKYASYVEEESESDSDVSGYEASRRRRVEEDEARRAREKYYDTVRRQKEEAAAGYYDVDPRAKKTLASDNAARDYIERSRGGARPSVERVSSSRGPVEVLRSGVRPVMVRRGSERPRSSESPRRSSAREQERRSSAADAPEEPSERSREQRPPTLAQSKSSPAQIHIPSERPSRRQTEDYARQPPREPIRRSETMPTVSSRSRADNTIPVRSSGLRETIVSDGLPTPGATPEYSSQSAKYRYGKEYADDNEYPTPNGYRTEVREPADSRRPVTRSPSPMSRAERPRMTSSKYSAAPTGAAPLRTTSYVYTPSGVQETSPSSYAPRPTLGREESSRSQRLYGEVPTTKARYETTSPKTAGKYSPPLEDVRYQKAFRSEDVKMQTGYNSRRGSETIRPPMSRNGSYSASYVR